MFYDYLWLYSGYNILCYYNKYNNFIVYIDIYIYILKADQKDYGDL